MRTETAISLIGLAMDALVHRESCTKAIQQDVPSELLLAFNDLESAGKDTLRVRAWLSAHGVNLPATSNRIYRRRANNQVSERVEALIRELFARGWSKSAISHDLKINRRVVIRVVREALNAQKEDADKC